LSEKINGRRCGKENNDGQDGYARLSLRLVTEV
jgi:hypothetical protein